jgi:predicted AlkP superfamily pyrophosphatase or phosphodiesterase
MTRTVVLNVVGLTPSLIGDATPKLKRWSNRARVAAIDPAFPAVTCTAQSDYLTGRYPSTHGIVGNGWYSREDGEVRFWKQANALVQSPKIWDAARAIDPSFTCANLFWWFNMYSTVDFAVTPRPMYPADGRKLPDVHTHPSRLRDDLQNRLGQFPLFEFWGPRSSIRSTEWIAAAAKQVEEQHSPTLSLVYLPHLDYNLQKVGVAPDNIAADLSAIDRVVGDLIDFFEARRVSVVVLSEYGLRQVSRPIHLNRVLRDAGLITLRDELGLELLDAGASAAFAVADHQVAHVYIRDHSRIGQVADLIRRQPGVEMVLDRSAQAGWQIDHARSGELIVVAEPDAWFTYYYWLDDARAPDFARTVDIHRKPGYDPVELFLDPAIKIPALSVGWKLAKRKLGFRTLLDVTPLDASLVKGSHGRRDAGEHGPLVMTTRADLLPADTMRSIDVHNVLLAHLTAGGD